MDGLLLDSEKVVRRAWDFAGEKLGYRNFGDHIYNTVGFNLKRRTEYFRACLGQDFPMDIFTGLARQRYYQIAQSEGIEVKPGAEELLSWARKKGLRLGLATSSRKVHAQESLRKAGLYDYFDGAVFGDSVKEGKPNPEIYLKACDAIGISPSCAVALEDAPSGILSAAAAGMRVIVVPDLVEPPAEILEKVWHRVDHLGEIIALLEK